MMLTFWLEEIVNIQVNENSLWGPVLQRVQVECFDRHWLGDNLLLGDQGRRLKGENFYSEVEY